MKKGNIEIISDDGFLANGLLSLINEKIPSLLSNPVMIIDIDRISNLPALEGYIRRATTATAIYGLSRNGIMSRLLSLLPSVSIDAPITQFAKKMSEQRPASGAKSFWLAQCQIISACKRLTPIQSTVLSGFGQGFDLHRISRATGIHPKTCYSHVSAITTTLNLRNITELRYFAALLLHEQRFAARYRCSRYVVRNVPNVSDSPSPGLGSDETERKRLSQFHPVTRAAEESWSAPRYQSTGGKVKTG
ncbi:helix-turn-helix transcriptional regulator [Enterobacter kobei]